MPASVAFTDDLYTNHAESSAAAARRPPPSSMPNPNSFQAQSSQSNFSNRNDLGISEELLTTNDKRYTIYDAATAETFLE